MDTPLHLLKNEDTFAVNNIKKIFPYTTWRPKYYVRTDDLYDDQLYDDVFVDIMNEIREPLEAGAYAFLAPFFYKIMAREFGGRVHGILPICGEQKWHVGSKFVPDEWHWRMKGKTIKEFCSFGGSLAVAIQLVNFEMGKRASYDAIYLLGCDLGFSKQGKDHFIDDYYDYENDPIPPEVREADLLHAHEIAHKCSPIPIYNATIGGELEVYPRVNIWEVLGLLETDHP